MEFITKYIFYISTFLVKSKKYQKDIFLFICFDYDQIFPYFSLFFRRAFGYRQPNLYLFKTENEKKKKKQNVSFICFIPFLTLPQTSDKSARHGDMTCYLW